MKKPSTIIIGAATLAAAVGVAIAGASLANAESTTTNSNGYAAPQQGGYGQTAPSQYSEEGPNGADGPNGQAPDPHTAFHPGETLLSGTTKDKVTAAARAREPGATIERVETDAEGVYEAHMVRTDGTHVTVQVGRDFTVTGVQVQGEGGRGRGHDGPPAGVPSGSGATGSGSGTTGSTSGYGIN